MPFVNSDPRFADANARNGGSGARHTTRHDLRGHGVKSVRVQQCFAKRWKPSSTLPTPIIKRTAFALACLPALPTPLRGLPSGRGTGRLYAFEKAIPEAPANNTPRIFALFIFSLQSKTTAVLEVVKYPNAVALHGISQATVSMPLGSPHTRKPICEPT